MDQETLLQVYKRRIEDPDLELPSDELLEDILDTAKMLILNKRYPFRDPPVDDENVPILEDKYQVVQLNIAIEIYNKIGAEGQRVHGENAIDREYASGFISPEHLKSVVPHVGVKW